MSFRDLGEFLDPTLKLPIRGKTYTVQSPDARTGLWVQSLISAAEQLRAGERPTEGELESLVLDDEDERSTLQRVLGDAFEEMSTDQVPWRYIQHAGQTTMLWIVHGQQVAERYWNGPDAAPKGRKKNRRGGAKKGRPDSDGSSPPHNDSSEKTAGPGPSSSAGGS